MGREAAVIPTQDPEARCRHQVATPAETRVGSRHPKALHCFWQGVLGVGAHPPLGPVALIRLDTLLCDWAGVLAPLLPVFVGLLSWQLRLIRDPVSHNVHRACLGEAS